MGVMRSFFFKTGNIKDEASNALQSSSVAQDEKLTLRSARRAGNAPHKLFFDMKVDSFRKFRFVVKKEYSAKVWLSPFNGSF
jgi:hypothetical protein